MSKEGISSTVPNAQVFQAIYIGSSQEVAIGATSTQSSAVGPNTSIVRLVSDADCYVAIGSNPTAAAGGCLLSAGLTEYFACDGGDKVAVIQKSAAGTLNITEGA